MRYLSILFLLCIFSITANSQVVITIDITGGYSAPLARQMASVVRAEIGDTSFPYSYLVYAKMKGISYGQGGNLALNINWYSKKNIGGGIKFNTFFSQKFAFQTRVFVTNGIVLYDYSSKVFSFQFIPHLSFRHDYKVVSPVLEAGMIIGLARINQKSTYTYNFNSDKIETGITHSGNVMLGFYSSVGLSFNVSKVVKINVAVNCHVASYSPSKWKRTDFTLNGVDRLGALSPASRQGTYVSSLDLTASQQNAPESQDLKFSVPVSGIGLNAGICFYIGSKAKKEKKKSNKDNEVQPF